MSLEHVNVERKLVEVKFFLWHVKAGPQVVYLATLLPADRDLLESGVRFTPDGIVDCPSVVADSCPKQAAKMR